MPLFKVNFQAGLASLNQLANDVASTKQVSSKPSQHRLSDKTNKIGGKRNPCDLPADKSGGGGKRRCDRAKDGHASPCPKGFDSIEEVIRAVSKDKHNMSPQDMSTVWTRLAWLVIGSTQPFTFTGDEHKQDSLQLVSVMETFTTRTLFDLKKYKPDQLCQTALDMAKIIKVVTKNGSSEQKLNLHQIFHRTLVRRKGSLFKAIASAAGPLLPQFKPKGYTNLAYACAIARVLPTFEGSTLFEHLTNALVAHEDLRSFNSHDLSNIVWAFAKAQVYDARLLGKVAYEVVEYCDLSTFKPQATAKVQVSDTHLFDKVACEVIVYRDLSTFKSHELSSIVWAFATAEVRALGLFKRVATEVVARDLSSFNSQDLSNIVWAFATAKVPADFLFDQVSTEALRWDFGSFNPQILANIVWAFATAEASVTRLFGIVAHELIESRDLASFVPQHIVTILWAFATAKVFNHTLFQKVAEVIVIRYASFQPSELSNIALAFATAKVPAASLFDKVATETLHWDLSLFKPNTLSNLVWAYARSNIGKTCVFGKVAAAIIRVIKRDLASFAPYQLSNIAWAFATANRFDGSRLFHAIARSASELLEQFNCLELADIAWSYAVVDVDPPGLFGERFVNLLLQKMSKLNPKGRRQLYQWHIWQKEEKSNAGLPTVLERNCQESLFSNRPTRSAEQKDVKSILLSIGLEPKEEVLAQSKYRLLTIEVNGKKVGIEMDGSKYFMSKRSTGNIVLKQRQIEALDRVSLLSVPYWEWGQLGQDVGEKRRYLRSMLGM